jgi:hypothetical protein
LAYLRSAGAAVHIVSHGNREEIVKVGENISFLCTTLNKVFGGKQALEYVGLSIHFPSENIVDWEQMQMRRQGSKMECVLEVQLSC